MSDLINISSNCRFREFIIMIIDSLQSYMYNYYNQDIFHCSYFSEIFFDLISSYNCGSPNELTYSLQSLFNHK